MKLNKTQKKQLSTYLIEKLKDEENYIGAIILDTAEFNDDDDPTTISDDDNIEIRKAIYKRQFIRKMMSELDLWD